MTVTPVSGDTRIRDLEYAVARLSARVDALEHARLAAAPPLGVAPSAGPHATQEPVAQTTPLVTSDVSGRASPGWLGLIGRTLIVLGGAFSLRALTNTGQVPMDAGLWLGLAYAAVFLILAGRASGPSAFFHGLSALVVALPLLGEAVLGFKVMSGAVGSVALIAVAMAALGVAWHRGQHALGMTTVLGALVTGLGLAIGLSQTPGGTAIPPALALIVIGTGALWASYFHKWNWMPWPAAIGADIGVLILALRASAVPPREAPLPAQIVHGVLIALYLGSFVIRIVMHERNVRLFEIAQTTFALAIGLGGAVAIAHANHIGVITLSLPTLLAGSILYVQTFTTVAPRRGFGSEFYYIGATALTLTIAGVSLLFDYPTRPIAIAIGALAGSLAAWRLGHPLLALQGAIAAVVAAAQSGLITFTTMVWLTHSQTWPAFGVPIALVLTAVLAALMIPRAVHSDEPPILTSIARTALSLALVAGIGSLAVIAVSEFVGTDAGVMATMKTIVLAGAAVGLAWIGRWPRFVEFGWLAYAALAAGGLKFLFEDFPTSRPATLFIALAAYGAAMISVPKLGRKT